MTYDSAKARRANELYTAIESWSKGLKYLDDHARDTIITFEVKARTTRRGQGSYDDRVPILDHSLLPTDEVTRLAVIIIAARRKYMLDSINRAGRELAQLGFVKPECCK